MRSNPVYYISPSNISITANANGNADDLAVYIAEETKIKVYSDKHPELAPTDGGYLEWFLTGRNRRLRYSDRPYTIYARLNRNNITDGYLVFAPQEQHNGVWCDPYSTVTNDGNGYSILYIDEETGSKMQTISPMYWYIKLGTVSLPVNNQRALENFDTGILGTDQYNVEWQTNPDQMPLRVEITNSRDNYAWTKKRPYVEWDKTITLDARLLRGWAEDAAALVHHWEIARDTGDANAAADAAWNDIDRSGGFGQSGHIVLSHESGEFDDFSAAVSATFTITAYGVEKDSDSSSSDSSSSSSDEPAIVALASASITIDAETVEKYGLSLSSNVMHYDGSDYVPAAGITIRIRGKAEDGTVHILTQSEIEQALLSAYYNPVDATDSSHDVPLVFSNGRAIVPTTAFAAEKSINVHLMYGASDDSSSSDSDSNSSSSDEPSTGTEIDTAAIGYVRDGDKGDPGENAIRIDLDNEYDSILYDGAGNKVSGNVQTTAYLFDGTEDKSSYATFTISNRSGMSDQQATISGRVVTVSDLTSDGTVTVCAEYPSGKYHYADFTIKKLEGTDKYDVVVTPNAVPVNTSNTVADTTLSVQVYRTPANGGTRHLVPFTNKTTNNYGLTLSVKDSLNNSLTETTGTGEVTTRTFNLTGTMATAADNVMVVLTKDNKTQDSETVPITHVHNGIDGSGSNAVKIDLDNEMDSIPCDSDGRVTSQTVLEVNARIYDGGSPVSSGVTVSSVGGIAGVSAVTSISNGVVNIKWTIPATGSGTPLSVDKFTSQIVLTWGGNSYYATFTANVVKSGQPGVSPTIFQLLPSPSQISFKRDSSGTIPSSTQTLSLSIKKSDGNGQSVVSVVASGLTVRYSTNGAPQNASDGTAWPSAGLSISSSVTYGNIYIAAFDGNGTLVDRETVGIMKDGENGTNAQYIYLKGTARDEDGEIQTTIPCVVNINGGTNQATIGRGLNLVTINRQTLAVMEAVNYDTWDEAFGGTGATGITDLIAKLNALDDSVFVCLVSWDAVGWIRTVQGEQDDTLITKLQGYGMSDLPYTDTARHPFLFIGYKGLGKDNGQTRMRDVGAYTDVVELAAYVGNGALTVKDGVDGKDGEDGDDGAPAAHLEMDNYESTVIIDADGGVAQSIPLNYARFYVGNEPVTPTWGMSISGGGGTHAGWNIVATGTEAVRTLMFVNSLSTPIASEGVYTVEVTATYNGESYVAKWTINVVRETISYSIEAEPGMFIYNETKKAWDVPSIALHIVRIGSYSGRKFLNDVPSGYTFGARWNGETATVNHSPLSMTWTLSPKGCYDSSGNIVGHVVYLTKTGYSLELEIPTYVRNDAVPRPREWVTGVEVKYYSGVEGEDFRDVIAYNDGNGNVTWYSCVATTDDDFEPEDGDTPADYPAYFTEADGQFEFVATNLLLAQMAYIKNLGVQYLRMGGWPSGETAPAGYEPQAGAIEMYDLEGENVLFRVKDGQVEANTGTFNNVRVNGTVNAVTGSFSGHLKSVPTIIHSHNINDFVKLEINPFTGLPCYMIDVNIVGRTVMFFETNDKSTKVPAASGTTNIFVLPQNYGSIVSALTHRSDYDANIWDALCCMILPYVKRSDTAQDHDYSAMIAQFGGTSDIGLRNLYRRWYFEKYPNTSLQDIYAISAQPTSKPSGMSDDDWNDWQTYPYRYATGLANMALQFVDSEITIMQLMNNYIGLLALYGVYVPSSRPNDPDAHEPCVAINPLNDYIKNVHVMKCEHIVESSTNTARIHWIETKGSIYNWDRYTLGLEDWPKDSSSDSSSD